MFDLDHFSAQNEKHFADHWIETPSFELAATHSVPIVFGAKGAGKSALLRFLTQLRRDESISCVGLDLSEFSHAQVKRQVEEIVQNLHLDDSTLLANYWRHLFLLHCLHDVSLRAQPSDERERRWLTKIREVLKRYDLSTPPHHVVTGWLGRAKQYLDRTLVRKRDTGEPVLVGGLTREELTCLENLPDDDAFTQSCLLAASLLMKDRRHVCLIVDGLDQVRAVDLKAHAFVMNSIIQAVKRLALDQSLCSAFSVKVLVPRELFLAIFDRDLDQYVTLQTHLSWDPRTLTSLLARRIAATGARAGAEAPMQLKDFLPESLPCGQQTLEFLIRHTMYRPRQLLTYFHSIAQAQGWLTLDRTRWQPAPAERVIQQVAAESTELTQYFLREYQLKHGQLEQHLSALAGLSCVSVIGELKKRWGDATEQVLKVLYECGAIGILEETAAGVRYDPSACYRLIDGERRPIYCEFIYKPGARLYWLPALPDETLIVVHPMLIRHFGIGVEPHYIVG